MLMVFYVHSFAVVSIHIHSHIISSIILCALKAYLLREISIKFINIVRVQKPKETQHYEKSLSVIYVSQEFQEQLFIFAPSHSLTFSVILIKRFTCQSE